jgi:dTDP-4-dehydrorhamnose reductase
VTIFLAGASGLVGSAFAAAAARRGHRVIGTVGNFAGEIPGLHETVRLNLADEAAVTTAVLNVFPEAIINCAAVSSPEACDTDPAAAQALNVALPATLARLAHHVSARFIHVSSEQVFAGEMNRVYAVGDATAPINLYGRQKVESERLVHAVAREFAVTLRAPLLMGNSLAGKRSTHERLLADWAAGRPAKLYTDEYRQPCTAENLADAMLELGERNDVRGVFHWGGTELLSRYELGCRIRARFKLSERDAPIVAVHRAETPEISRRRHPSLALNLAPLAGTLKTRPQSLEEQLDGLIVPVPVRPWFHALS